MWNRHVKDEGFGQSLCAFVLRVEKLKLIIPYNFFHVIQLHSGKKKYISGVHDRSNSSLVPLSIRLGQWLELLLSNSVLLQAHSLDRRC